MDCERNYYSNKLQEVLVSRQRDNSSYSLRAFSKYLKMHPSTLSLVLKGKRPLPHKNVDHVISKLELSYREEALFRESLKKKKITLDRVKISKEYFDRFLVDESKYKIIAEWEHYAVLTLMELDAFVSTHEFIAQRLNISLPRVEIVIKNLQSAELVGVNEEGNYFLTQGPLKTTEDISSKALRVSHKETLDVSKNKLDEVEVELRDFSSMTIAVNPNHLPKAKTIIREFRQKMASLLRDGERSEVFQLAIQLYPLTNIEKKEV